MSLDEGLIPREWKTTRVTPLQKSGPSPETENYRQIFVLPALSKILEGIVHRQLLTFLKEIACLSTINLAFEIICLRN